ncbi:MAG: DMP19 family protein [Prevotella sp.]|nr:DMP19 family protein [Prevotella sp.]
MTQITVRDQDLGNAALQGMGQFVQVFVDAIRQAIGGEPTAETIAQLNADQMTLLCWDTLRQEVMEGGFVQLIHNGYGTFIFKNPFAKALNKMWGMRDLSKMLYEVHTLWLESREALEADCTDEEFMALYEQHPQFDDYDDLFIENEEQWTDQIAHYVDNNIEKFATIIP